MGALAYEGNYHPAYLEAVRKFATQDPNLMAQRSGTQFDANQGLFLVPYCGEEYLISFPEGRVQAKDSQAVHLSDCTLLILYLVSASGLPPLGRWVSFLELPGGPHHYNLFLQEGPGQLATAFGTQPESLLAAGRKLGATPFEKGDAGLIIRVLPRLWLAVILWGADDEFPARANVLFDAVASTYLDAAGLFVLGINTCLRLIHAGGSSG